MVNRLKDREENFLAVPFVVENFEANFEGIGCQGLVKEQISGL